MELGEGRRVHMRNQTPLAPEPGSKAAPSCRRLDAAPRVATAHLSALQDPLQVDLFEEGIQRQPPAALVLVQRGQQARALRPRGGQDAAGDGGGQGLVQVIAANLRGGEFGGRKAWDKASGSSLAAMAGWRASLQVPQASCFPHVAQL